MKLVLLFILSFSLTSAIGQTVIEAVSITSDAGEFNASLAPPETMGLNVNASTTSATTFPYAPGTQFAADIGYVSSSGVMTGTITHTFNNPTSVSQVLLWNAYFDFELDHSIKDVVLTFYDNVGGVITTENVSFSQASAAVLTPEVVNLSSEVFAVKSIDCEVQTLWGGNEISIRRFAYAGSGISVSNDDLIMESTKLNVYPNPALNTINIPASGVTDVKMFDETGREVDVLLNVNTKSADLSWDRVTPGIYHIKVTTEDGLFHSRVKVLN